MPHPLESKVVPALRRIDGKTAFEFGADWRRFLRLVDHDRVLSSSAALRELLQSNGPSGKSFLDAGCGSGLASVAARQLGVNVVAFDYDPETVECAKELRERFARDDGDWVGSCGSLLDATLLRSLGTLDVLLLGRTASHRGDVAWIGESSSKRSAWRQDRCGTL